MFYNIKRRAKRTKRAERKKKRKGGIPYYIYKEGGGREDGRGWEEEKRGEGEKWGIWGNFI